MSGTIKLFCNNSFLMEEEYSSVTERQSALRVWKQMFKGEDGEYCVHICPLIVDEDEPKKGKIRTDIKAKYVGKLYHIPK